MPASLHRLALPALAALSLAGCAAQSTTTASSPSVRSATTSGSAAPMPTRPSSHRPSGTTTTAAGRLALITEPQAGVAPVLSALRGARHQVDMVMYEDEDSQVNAALAADEHRGVKVRVLLNGGYYGEGSKENQTAYTYLQAHSVPVKWTPSYFALTHQKTLLVDGRAYIFTFNLTPQYYASSRDFGVIDTIAADDAPYSRRSTPTGPGSASPPRTALTFSGAPAPSRRRSASSSPPKGSWASTTRRWIRLPSSRRSRPTPSAA